jgi:hypothetical protein
MTFCSDCIHCHPDKGFGNLFGLFRTSTYHWAKCAFFRKHYTARDDPDSMFFCKSINNKGDCKGFELRYLPSRGGQEG